tara:strand:- start:498 stop:827 length:330 start_codon:yes stop_codon:yes gene_type:complete
MRLLLLLAGIAFATSSFAEPTTKPDQSGDRKNYSDSMFQNMDTDQDGNISRVEYEAGLRKKMEKRMAHFNAMDADGNGLVSKTEAMEAKQRMKAEWKEKRRLHCNKTDK